MPAASLLVALGAPIAGIAVVSTALAYSVPLFSLLMEAKGAAGWEIGLNHALAAVAMVLAAPVMPRILSRIGAFWLTVGSVAMMALSLLAIPLSETQLWWGVLRVVFGAGMTALFFLSEFWLVERAPDAIRGRILSIYAVVLSAFYMLGPLLLNVLGTDSIWTFIVPAALIVLGAVPIIAARAEAPDTRGAAPTSPLSILRFFRTDPTLLWGVILFGAIEFGVMGLLSVWALRIGYDQEAAVQMVFWLAFGAFVFQPVLGFAADKFDRRYLMLGAAVVAAIAPMIIVPLALSQSAVAVLLLCWGGMGVGLYFLALAEMGARYSGADLADANAALVLAYGLGALGAPAAFGAAMDVVPPHGALWLAGLLGVAYTVLAFTRIALRPRDA